MVWLAQHTSGTGGTEDDPKAATAGFLTAARRRSRFGSGGVRFTKESICRHLSCEAFTL
jgi:hypothetical protein